MANNYEVLEYKKLRFDGSWTRSIVSNGMMRYKTTGEAGLLVVSEGSSGLWSYDYRFEANLEVFVDRDYVHIPDHYKDKSNANMF